MSLMGRKFTSNDIKKASESLINCPFCGSDKVKITTISKGSNKGDKVQGICNKCFARGPVTSDDPYKAAELWNMRSNPECDESNTFVLDTVQMGQFITGKILLNTVTKQEYMAVLKYCQTYIENSIPSKWEHCWGEYKQNTVLNARSSILDKDKPWIGYSDIGYYKQKSNKEIQRVKVIRK